MNGIAPKIISFEPRTPEKSPYFQTDRHYENKRAEFTPSSPSIHQDVTCGKGPTATPIFEEDWTRFRRLLLSSQSPERNLCFKMQGLDLSSGIHQTEAAKCPFELPKSWLTNGCLLSATTATTEADPALPSLSSKGIDGLCESELSSKCKTVSAFFTLEPQPSRPRAYSPKKQRTMKSKQRFTRGIPKLQFKLKLKLKLKHKRNPNPNETLSHRPSVLTICSPRGLKSSCKGPNKDHTRIVKDTTRNGPVTPQKARQRELCVPPPPRKRQREEWGSIGSSGDWPVPTLRPFTYYAKV